MVAGRKGGSGKTTLSGHLAVQAERCKDGPVAMLDYDPQRGLAAWWDQRKDDVPVLIRTPALKDLPATIETVRSQGFKQLVIDTPPVVTDVIERVMEQADLIMIPVRPSPHDLRAVGATIDLADKSGKPMVFVISQAIARTRVSQDAVLALSEHGTVSRSIIHSRIDYATSMADGRTVQEAFPASKSSEEISELWKYLRALMDRKEKVKAHA
ncbi:MAG: ParA family protein [Rhodopila sp.]